MHIVTHFSMKCTSFSMFCRVSGEILKYDATKCNESDANFHGFSCQECLCTCLLCVCCTHTCLVVLCKGAHCLCREDGRNFEPRPMFSLSSAATHSQIRLLRSLKKDNYQLPLLITDSGVPPLSNNTEVKVQVCICNKNRMHCSSAHSHRASFLVPLATLLLTLLCKYIATNSHNNRKLWFFVCFLFSPQFKSEFLPIPVQTRVQNQCRQTWSIILFRIKAVFALLFTCKEKGFEFFAWEEYII